MGDEEKAIAKRFHDSDLEALEMIINKYQTMIYRMGLKLFRNEAEAADFAQDAFLRAFEKRKKYNPLKPFQPWFLKVALNVGRMGLKRRRELPMGDNLPELYTAPMGESRLIREEQKGLVQQALRKLPSKYRESLILRFEAELSLKEIAGTLGISLGTVKSRLHRALINFQQEFQALGGEA